MSERRVTLSVEELTLSNSLQLTALVELLEERRILTRDDVLRRMREVRDGQSKPHKEETRHDVSEKNG